MPQNEKEKNDGSWEEDQKEREYYYDDAHGYEDYDPDEDDRDAAEEGRGDAVTPRRGDGATR